MKLSLSLMLVIPLLAGCQQVQDQLQSTGKRAADSAGNALRSGMADAQVEAKRLSDRSSQQALEAAREKLIDLQASLANLQAPSELDKAKLGAIEEQLAKVNAALNVRNLEAKLDEKLKEASELKENAGKTYDAVRRQLGEVDADYQDLKAKLAVAQQAYRESAEKVGL